MNSDDKPETGSVWPTLPVETPTPKKWAWVGIFKPFTAHRVLVFVGQLIFRGAIRLKILIAINHAINIFNRD